MQVSHNSKQPQLHRSQGPIKKQLKYKQEEYSAGKLTHKHDVASCSAGGRQVCIALEPAGCSTRPALLMRWLCCQWCLELRTRYNKKKLEKKIDMISARIELAPSFPKSGIVTILLYQQRSMIPGAGIIFRGAHDTPHTRAHHHSKRERGGDDRRRTAASEKATTVAIAVHHRSATRAWRGPLLLVRLGGVVTLVVLFACCLRSTFLGCASGKKHKTSEK